jgi:two-component system sensor histidine kinase/response regulator
VNAREATLLSQRVNTARHEATSVPVLIVASTGTSAGLLILLFLLALRENRLRQQAEARLGYFFTASLDLLCIAGLDGYFKRLNPAFSQLLGYSTEELLAQPFLEFVHADDRAATLAEVEKLTHGAPTIPFENRYRCKDGSFKWLEWKTQSDPAEGLLYAAARDMTKRNHAEAELSRQAQALQVANEQLHVVNAQLEEARHAADSASRAKSEFLAAMSHEIRTPMNGVIGMLDVLHQTSLKGAQVEMVELIRESAYSLLTIINDLLDYSKIEAGRLDIERIPFPVEEVVEQVCVVLDSIAKKAGVDLTLFIDPALPAEVLGDPNRLRQVLVNLLNNAIKFSGSLPRHAQVAVRVILTECSTERVMVEFCVSDNGIGMDAATVSRLFTPFTQADASTTRRFGGTGLGLAISHDLVKLMGGQIAVQSAVGEGSTFTVRLPFAPLAQEPDAGEKTSIVAGLSCVVVGSSAGLADDLAAYLSPAGATIHRELDIGNARQHVNQYPGGLLVWVIDTGDERPTPEELLAQADVRPDLDARLVIVAVERGQRRTPRRIAANVIMVDGNVLRRKNFLTAVAAAAGRAPLEEAGDTDKQAGARAVSLSREEALRRGCLILVVEDNETNQKVILAQLQMLGFTADVAGNGRDALQRWESDSYGLLLTDLHMPHMDGYELTAAIRAKETGARHMPIVALTANALKGEADRCREAGMDDYLSKPVPLADLKVILEQWLLVAPSAAYSTDIMPQPLLPQSCAGLSVDINVLKALVGDDAAVLHDVLEDFRSSIPRVVADLRAACAAGQVIAACAAAHKLKSSARAVGALALGELCSAMERAGEADDSAALAKRLPLFDAEIAAVDFAMSQLLASETGVRCAP